MKTESIMVENLKCGGCANTIKTRLQNLTGIFGVYVDKDNSVVTVEHSGSISRESITNILKQLGYPEADTTNTILDKAKSFVSCAVGRMSAEA
ncbi:MAG: heavy-metal-associated domain-containing protein [Runella sp.]